MSLEGCGTEGFVVELGLGEEALKGEEGGCKEGGMGGGRVGGGEGSGFELRARRRRGRTGGELEGRAKSCEKRERERERVDETHWIGIEMFALRLEQRPVEVLLHREVVRHHPQKQ